MISLEPGKLKHLQPEPLLRYEKHKPTHPKTAMDGTQVNGKDSASTPTISGLPSTWKYPTPVRQVNKINGSAGSTGGEPRLEVRGMGNFGLLRRLLNPIYLYISKHKLARLTLIMRLNRGAL